LFLHHGWTLPLEISRNLVVEIQCYHPPTAIATFTCYEITLIFSARAVLTTGAGTSADFQAIVANHLDQLRKFGPKPLPAAANPGHVAASAAFVREKLGDFFCGLN
jgi:hypothetical protein